MEQKRIFNHGENYDDMELSLMVETLGIDRALRVIPADKIVNSPRLKALWQQARDTIREIQEMLPDNTITNARAAIRKHRQGN